MSVAQPSRHSEPDWQSYAEHILFENVSWRFYDDVLRSLEGRNIRVTYDEGRLELMSPLLDHEHWKKLLGSLIEMLIFELKIPAYKSGSTTFRRKVKEKGAEPDESYYLADPAAMRGKRRVDLSQDPPPDLVVEIDITYKEIDREAIYAAFGVPELWRFDGKRLTFLLLDAGREYRQHDSSRAFPKLLAPDLERFLRRFNKSDETAVLHAWSEWVRKRDWA